MAKEISIQEVLATITDDARMGDTFTLRFVRSSGKKKGTLAIVAKARYGAPRGYRDEDAVSSGASGGSRRSYTKWLHTDHGTIPMTDTERNRYFTPLISHIIGFNTYKVIH